LDGHCSGFECRTQQDWIAQHQISNLTNKEVAVAGLVRINKAQQTYGRQADGSYKADTRQDLRSIREFLVAARTARLSSRAVTVKLNVSQPVSFSPVLLAVANGRKGLIRSPHWALTTPLMLV
jgi:hypothetical protein